jgi:hypothetical protein
MFQDYLIVASVFMIEDDLRNAIDKWRIGFTMATHDIHEVLLPSITSK